MYLLVIYDDEQPLNLPEVFTVSIKGLKDGKLNRRVFL